MKWLIAILILATVLIAGCTANELAPGQLAKNSGEVKTFLSEYPHATVIATLFSDISIKEECGNPQLPIKDYYKVTVKDPDTNMTLIVYIDADSQKTVCAIRTGVITENNTNVTEENITQNATKYVCSDGSIVYDSSLCSKPKDKCENVVCNEQCSGSTRYYNGKCDNGQCKYSSEVCEYGCSNNKCNSKPNEKQIFIESAYYSASGGYVSATVRNTGTEDIKEELEIAIDGKSCPTYNSNKDKILEGETATISITNTTAACPNKILTISIGDDSTASKIITCYETNITPQCQTNWTNYIADSWGLFTNGSYTEDFNNKICTSFCNEYLTVTSHKIETKNETKCRDPYNKFCYNPTTYCYCDLNNCNPDNDVWSLRLDSVKIYKPNVISITIRNTGTLDIDINKLFVVIDNNVGAYTPNTGTLEPNQIITINITSKNENLCQSNNNTFVLDLSLPWSLYWFYANCSGEISFGQLLIGNNWSLSASNGVLTLNIGNVLYGMTEIVNVSYTIKSGGNGTYFDNSPSCSGDACLVGSRNKIMAGSSVITATPTSKPLGLISGNAYTIEITIYYKHESQIFSSTYNLSGTYS
jgi:hypothetical protein